MPRLAAFGLSVLLSYTVQAALIVALLKDNEVLCLLPDLSRGVAFLAWLLKILLYSACPIESCGWRR
jgi:hypothetical protein